MEAVIPGDLASVTVLDGQVIEVSYTGGLIRVLSSEEEGLEAERLEQLERARGEHDASIVEAVEECGGQARVEDFNYGPPLIGPVVLATWPGTRLAILPAYVAPESSLGMEFYHYYMRNEYYGNPLRDFARSRDIHDAKVVVSDRWITSGGKTDNF